MESRAVRALERERQVRRSFARVLLALLAALAALASACTGDILEPEGGAVRTSAGPAGPSQYDVSGSVCPLGQIPCAGRCADPTSDSANCGGCDRPCPAGLLCFGAQCTRVCGTGDSDCGGACVPVASDASNCGTCGHACAPGEFCNAGVCGATCSFQVCQTATGLDCADTATNSRHCGGCNAACPPGQSCAGGICRLVCPGGFTACGAACAATATDASNCGGCGVVCAGGQPCIGGSCGCPPGQALCNGACQDVTTSTSSCGGCGKACGGGSTCAGGACTCGPGTTLCGGATCAALLSDPAHCGDCARACAPSEICDQGACKPKDNGCSGGLSLCSGSCVDTVSSAQNCGTCGHACAPGELCSAGVCGCPGGQKLCGGACVDVLSNNTHCGGCDVPCTSGRTCANGACSCGVGQDFCGGACVDVQANDTHCGGCDRPCSGGTRCATGACACPAGAQSCGGACVDTLTSGDHCGRCDAPCTGGSVCAGGVCACTNGQTLCDGQCVDTQTSLQHCGTCGHACFGTEVCSAGTCQGPLGADGCSGSAQGVSLGSIAAYQSVKIPIMTNGQAVGRGAGRPADVVQGRETLFRVFVTPGAGFGARELSARLTLANGATSDQYFAKQTVRGASTDADTTSTFQIFVPPDKIGADTRYAVELVECGGAPSGSGGAPRFPATGDTALEARQTGPLKVRVVPVSTNGRVPDTSDAALGVYRSYLTAMYPATDVQLSVATEISTAYPVNWTGLLDQIRAKRQSDAPPADVYYYGFLKPTDTFRQYCQTSCTAGIGYVGGATQPSSRAAVGLAFVDEASASTMAHEVGHNHGRNHAPCAPGGGITGVDGSYPYPNAAIGVWGYDPRSRALFDPNLTTDIMGYCNNKWVSDYTYRGFTDRVAYVNGAPLELFSPELIGKFHVLLLDSAGPRWGIPFDRPAEAFGDPEPADILDANGDAIGQVTVYRSEIPDTLAASVLVPEPEPGWVAVHVAGWPPVAFAAQSP